MASQLTGLTIVYPTVFFSGKDERRHQSSASLTFVREIHRRRGKCFHLMTSSWSAKEPGCEETHKVCTSQIYFNMIIYGPIQYEYVLTILERWDGLMVRHIFISNCAPCNCGNFGYQIIKDIFTFWITSWIWLAGEEHPGAWRSMTRLLVHRLLKSPVHQQAWYCLCRIDTMYCCSRVDVIYLGHAKSKIRFRIIFYDIENKLTSEVLREGGRSIVLSWLWEFRYNADELRRHPIRNTHGFVVPRFVVVILSDPWGPFYQHGLNLIPAWISNYIHYNVWDEIRYSFPKGLGMYEWFTLVIHAGIKDKLC